MDHVAIKATRSPFLPSGYPGESDSFLETATHSLQRPSVPWNGRLFP